MRLGAGKYKLVTLAHQELNIYKVFWDVQARSGYQTGCANKQWKVWDGHLHHMCT